MFTAEYYKLGKHFTKDFDDLEKALRFLCQGILENTLHPVGILHNKQYLIETTRLLKLRDIYADLKNYHYNKSWNNVVTGLLHEI